MITIDIKSDQISAALANLAGALSNSAPLMGRLAKHLQGSTEDRFLTGIAPNGSVWAAKSPVTIAAQARRTPPHLNSRPLFGPSSELHSTIGSHYGPDFAEVSSGRPYAAMQQFGGSKSAFPHLWGDIPARPFLGISDEDEVALLDICEEWLQTAATAGA